MLSFKNPSKSEPQLWLTQRVLSALSLLSPPRGRDRCASFVSIFDSSRNSSFASRGRPPLSPLGLFRTLPGQQARQVAGGAAWGAASTWSKPCVRTERLSPPPPRPLQLLPASLLGGREHSAPPGVLLGSSFLQQNASRSLSPGGGQPGFAQRQVPLSSHLSSCADSFRIH